MEARRGAVSPIEGLPPVEKRLTNAMTNFDAHYDRRDTGSLKWNKYADTDILPFWVADMDFRSPEPVLQALRERVDHGIFGYTLAETLCTEAVLEYLQQQHSWKVEPDWLLWTPGLVPAINLACRAFAEPGDGILTFTPVYYPFLSAPQYANQELQTVPLIWSSTLQEWEIDFERLEATVHKRSRILILSNPHNPVGKVFSRSEMERLASTIVRHDLILISDEIHCDLILNEKDHVCAGSLGSELLRRVVVMFSPSKTYNLAGLACAYLVIPDAGLRARFQRSIRGILTEVNCMGYTACEAAYRFGEPWRGELLAYLNGNRACLYETLESSMPGLSLFPMDATYLAWIDARELGLKQPAQYFERFGVGLSEGSGFHGDGFVRMNFGCPRDQLTEGLTRMKRGLESLG